MTFHPILRSQYHDVLQVDRNYISFPDFYYAVVWLANVLVNGDRANTIGNDMSTGWIFNVFNMPTDICLNGRIFEYSVAHLVEGTVFQDKILRVTQQLFAS